MSNPFFSIIVPCCDVEPYVRECFESVARQGFGDWEFVAGVEKSKDATEAVLRELAANDPRIRIFTSERSGSCSASRNTGCAMAHGEYVIFLDGDDTIADGSLQRIHDKIASSPGADLYPCAIQVHNDMTGKDEEVRDNYPKDCTSEMTGPEATIKAYEWRWAPCPMLQLTVFRRQFLIDNDLKCIYGLRRQDSEFFPRALYLAKRVVPLHEPFYIYRIQAGSVSSSARGAGYFLGDWAVILKSLFAFHAAVDKDTTFDRRIGRIWAGRWLNLFFYFWFTPAAIAKVPRDRRVKTLCTMFEEGFDDFDAILKLAPFTKRIEGGFAKAFVKYPALRTLSELFFNCYFALPNAKANGASK